MMKSQFDPVLKIYGGFLRATGPLDPPADDEVFPTRYLAWLVEQDGAASSGVIQPWGSVWRGDSSPEGLIDGPAHATAVLVTLAREGVQTFSWSSEVTLQHAD